MFTLLLAGCSNEAGTGSSDPGSSEAAAQPVTQSSPGPPQPFPITAHGYKAQWVTAYRYVPGLTEFDAQAVPENVATVRVRQFREIQPGPDWVFDELTGPLVGDSHDAHGWLGWYDNGLPIVFSSGFKAFRFAPLTLQDLAPSGERGGQFAMVGIAMHRTNAAELWLLDPEEWRRPNGERGRGSGSVRVNPFSDEDYATLIARALKAVLAKRQIPTLLEVIERQQCFDTNTLDLLVRIASSDLQVVEMAPASELYGRRGGDAVPLIAKPVTGEYRADAAILAFQQSEGIYFEPLVQLWHEGVDRNAACGQLLGPHFCEPLFETVRKDLIELHRTEASTWGWPSAARLVGQLAGVHQDRAMALAEDLLAAREDPKVREAICTSIAEQVSVRHRRDWGPADYQSMLASIASHDLQSRVAFRLVTYKALGTRGGPMSEGRRQVGRGEVHWLVESMAKGLEREDWPSPQLRNQAVVRACRIAGRVYQASITSHMPAPWPDGLAGRLMSPIDAESISTQQIVDLAEVAISGNRLAALQWLANNLDHQRLRDELHPEKYRAIVNSTD